MTTMNGLVLKTDSSIPHFRPVIPVNLDLCLNKVKKAFKLRQKTSPR